MKQLLLILAFASLLTAQVRIPGPGGAPAGAPPAGLTLTELTQGSGADPVTTANISPTANAVVFATVAIAEPGGDTANSTGDVLSVSGCSLTWNQIAVIAYQVRRALYVYRGTSATPGSACALTIDYTNGGGTLTVLEVFWSIDEATNVDLTTPVDSALSNTTSSATSLGISDVGTPGTGDCTFGAFAIEGATVSATLEAGFTSLSNIGGGSDIRTLVLGYDCTGTIDETPSVSWTGAEGAGGIGLIINVAP